MTSFKNLLQVCLIFVNYFELLEISLQKSNMKCSRVDTNMVTSNIAPWMSVQICSEEAM